MTLHHLINELTHTFCPYCKHPFNGERWDYLFYAKHYYKGITCNCGKELMLKIDTFGVEKTTFHKPNSSLKKSDDDEKIKTLEHKIKIIK